MTLSRSLYGLLAAALAIIGLLSSTANAAEPFLEQHAVFVSGEGGYHTYRIPVMSGSKKGTVLAFCEGRKAGSSDAGDIDLLVRRSFDGGKTFQPTQVIHEEGGEAKITIGNPCPVVDTTGTIHLLFARNNRRAFHIKSTDDGATFSSPVEITEAFRGFDEFPWTRLATGPVHGILTRKGRMVVPVWINDKICRNYRSAVIYSDDNGSTWTAGGIVQPLKDCNECTVVEAADGSLLLNMRTQGKKPRARAVAVSHDGGVTWGQPKHIDELVCPQSQAALLRFSYAEGDQKSRILFSNPDSATREQMRMAVKLSYDEGRTWPVAKLLSTKGANYSDLAVTGDKTILCLYEGGGKLTLARFNLAWLTDGKE